MKLEKRQISADDVEIGMYVSELDRPWIDSPFLIQGFLIRDNQDIQQIQNLCKYVYIDELQSKVDINQANLTPIVIEDKPEPRLKVDVTKASAAKKAIGKGGSIADIPAPAEPRVNFVEELEEARAIHNRMDKVVNNLYDSISRNKLPHIEQVGSIVSEVVTSLDRNEYALEWMSQLKDKNQFEAQHSMNVSIFSIKLGRHLGLHEDILNTLGICGLLHDIGKIKIPERILMKPGALTEDEMAIMQKHAEVGVKILKQTPNVPLEVISVCQKHHERMDGKGYPNQLVGDQLDLLTRIVSIADAYDAITSESHYNPGFSASHAMSELYRGKNKAYDAELVDAFIRAIGVFPVGTVIETHSGEVGIVVSTSDTHKLNPSVIMVLNHKKRPFEKPHILNTAKIMAEVGSGFRFNIKRALNPGNYDVHPKDHFVNF
ncbi:MAG: HD-GYP domain-containing protein [Gammaproteobacteria bacterium]|nr:HD-GYP domain-containing protein [Gammaproteobacteria bacterium]